MTSVEDMNSLAKSIKLLREDQIRLESKRDALETNVKSLRAELEGLGVTNLDDLDALKEGLVKMSSDIDTLVASIKADLTEAELKIANLGSIL